MQTRPLINVLVLVSAMALAWNGCGPADDLAIAEHAQGLSKPEGYKQSYSKDQGKDPFSDLVKIKAGLQTETFQTPSGPVTLTYELRNGKAYLQGDIRLNLQRLRNLNTSSSSSGGTSGGFGTSTSGLAAVSEMAALWPNAEVPYTIDTVNLPAALVTDIRNAIKHWEALTPLRFKDRTNQKDYVYFTTGDGCSSAIGRDGDRQEINLAANCGQAVVHELGHAIGLFHEQSREDRNEHVIIHSSNVTWGKGHNFDKYSDLWFSYDGQDLGPYDFNSVMHYGSFAFSNDPRGGTCSKDSDCASGQVCDTTATTPRCQKPTITRRHCSGKDCLIKSRRLLSSGDRRYVHELYCPLINWDASRCGQYLDPSDSPTFRLKVVGTSTDRCLDVANGDLNNHAGINAHGCHGGDNQLWSVDRISGNEFYIRAKHSGLCLDVPNVSHGFVNIQQHACNGGDNQKWLLVHSGAYINKSGGPTRRHGQFRVKAKHSGMCLGVNWANQLVQTTCTSSDAVTLELVVRELPYNNYQVRNTGFHDWCLDVPGRGHWQAPMQVYPCNKGSHQAWKLMPRPNGFALRAWHSLQCLGVKSGNLYQVPCGTAASPAPGTIFSLHMMADGAVELRTSAFRKCVEKPANGWFLRTATCSWKKQQRWVLRF